MLISMTANDELKLPEHRHTYIAQPPNKLNCYQEIKNDG